MSACARVCVPHSSCECGRVQFQCCFTSTEPIRTIRDGGLKTATSTFTQLLDLTFLQSRLQTRKPHRGSTTYKTTTEMRLGFCLFRKRIIREKAGKRSWITQYCCGRRKGWGGGGGGGVYQVTDLYAHFMYTSASCLHCPQNVEKHLRGGVERIDGLFSAHRYYFKLNLILNLIWYVAGPNFRYKWGGTSPQKFLQLS